MSVKAGSPRGSASYYRPLHFPSTRYTRAAEKRERSGCNGCNDLAWETGCRLRRQPLGTDLL